MSGYGRSPSKSSFPLRLSSCGHRWRERGGRYGRIHFQPRIAKLTRRRTAVSTHNLTSNGRIHFQPRIARVDTKGNGRFLHTTSPATAVSRFLATNLHEGNTAVSPQERRQRAENGRSQFTICTAVSYLNSLSSLFSRGWHGFTRIGRPFPTR